MECSSLGVQHEHTGTLRSHLQSIAAAAPRTARVLPYGIQVNVLDNILGGVPVHSTEVASQPALTRSKAAQSCSR